MKKYSYLLLCVGLCLGLCSCKNNSGYNEEKAKAIEAGAEKSAQYVWQLPLGFAFGMDKEEVQERIDEMIEDGSMEKGYQAFQVYYPIALTTKTGEQNVKASLRFGFYHGELYSMIFSLLHSDDIIHEALREYVDTLMENVEHYTYNGGTKEYPRDRTVWGMSNLLAYVDYNRSLKDLNFGFQNAPIVPKATAEYADRILQECGEGGGADVVNSPWDGSVRQVKKYLKKTLKDPKSYESIRWGDVKKTKDGFEVRHQYRAKNSFGGYVVSDQIFYLDKQGRVVNVVSL